MTVAEHHTDFDWATLITNIGIAAGTLGATLIALWLAFAGRRQATKARTLTAQQIVAVIARLPRSRENHVALVNGSAEIITRIEVRVSKSEDLTWVWPFMMTGRVPYLLAGQERQLDGHWDYHGDREFSDIVVSDDVVAGCTVSMIWTDAQGQRWYRESVDTTPKRVRNPWWKFGFFPVPETVIDEPRTGAPDDSDSVNEADAVKDT